MKEKTDENFMINILIDYYVGLLKNAIEDFLEYKKIPDVKLKKVYIKDKLDEIREYLKNFEREVMKPLYGTQHD